MMEVLLNRPVRRRPAIAFGMPIFRSEEAAVGPYPAPAGWRWAFVTENGNRMTDGTVPLVELLRIA